LVHYYAGARKTRPTPAAPDPQGQAAVATYLVTNFAVAKQPPHTRRPIEGAAYCLRLPCFSHGCRAPEMNIVSPHA